VALAAGVTVGVSSASRFALSPAGTLLYAVGAGSATELVWVSRDGTEQVLDSTWTGEISSPALSPDGARAAVAIQSEASMDIWIKQLDRGPATRLTLDGNRSDYPTWTPDGASVTFTSNRAGPSFDLWTKRADGSGAPVLERDEEWAIAEGLWSPDGAWLVHRTSTNERGAGDILAARPGSAEMPVPLAVTPFQELAPAISSDGRWLAYASLESGRHEVFVAPFPEAGTAKWQISVDGGTEPAWSRAGSELFYRNGRGDMVAVRLAADSSFRVGPASVLFSARAYLASSVHRQYDVAPDAARFLMVRPVGVGVERRLILVQNFAEELRARVPR
jgi:Tol biopolymer transport system component